MRSSAPPSLATTRRAVVVGVVEQDHVAGADVAQRERRDARAGGAPGPVAAPARPQQRLPVAPADLGERAEAEDPVGRPVEPGHRPGRLRDHRVRAVVVRAQRARRDTQQVAVPVPMDPDHVPPVARSRGRAPGRGPLVRRPGRTSRGTGGLELLAARPASPRMRAVVEGQRHAARRPGGGPRRARRPLGGDDRRERRSRPCAAGPQQRRGRARMADMLPAGMAARGRRRGVLRGCVRAAGARSARVAPIPAPRASCGRCSGGGAGWPASALAAAGPCCRSWRCVSHR